MKRQRIGRLFGALVATLGLAGTSAFTLGALPPIES
jgi:hypothetical protein